MSLFDSLAARFTAPAAILPRRRQRFEAEWESEDANTGKEDDGVDTSVRATTGPVTPRATLSPPMPDVQLRAGPVPPVLQHRAEPEPEVAWPKNAENRPKLDAAEQRISPATPQQRPEQAKPQVTSVPSPTAFFPEEKQGERRQAALPPDIPAHPMRDARDPMAKSGHPAVKEEPAIAKARSRAVSDPALYIRPLKRGRDEQAIDRAATSENGRTPLSRTPPQRAQAPSLHNAPPAFEIRIGRVEVAVAKPSPAATPSVRVAPAPAPARSSRPPLADYLGWRR